MNIACGIEYDGTDYHGFQRQPAAQGPTVQGVLETAIARIAGERVVVHGAGRTDAGVHASGQVINFHTTAQLAPEVWVRALNATLPPTVVVRWARAVPERFHARFSAISRSYRYTIWNDAVPTALLARFTYHRSQPLAVDLMAEACKFLLGTQDFGAFGRSPEDASHPDEAGPHHCIRTMLAASCFRYGPCIFCDFTANAFLTGMVRRLVGTLLLVGQGRLSLEEFAAIVRRAERSHPGVAVPARGLCLVGVSYPSELGLPEPPLMTPAAAWPSPVGAGAELQAD
ncbi:tRNA pseudouridine(38-40) synthase TruA [Thermogemmatispora sp.]|uniref:tRNA pseudouridine(38-40) synthase TruA n=1 Tax=Thermogemmatispora sp. TaxID=1968838 RepID=UPI0035E43A62